MERSRKKLSASGMLGLVRNIFKKMKIPQVKGNRKNPVTLVDCLMSALAVFGLKYPSLLQFDKNYNSERTTRHNLSALYGVKNAPCDTYMRERLDEIDPKELRKSFKSIFAEIQRGKELEKFQFIDGYYLVSMDGTGFFSSPKVHCDNCCEKNHRNGTKTYYHQMFCAAIVHPDNKTVIPFAPEPIMKGDGNKKNDCEINSAKRFIDDLKREHPHLKIIIVADSLHSAGPLLKILKTAGIRFIITVKPGSHDTLFKFVEGICKQHEETTKDGKTYQYRYVNSVPINDSNFHFEVNFLECIETDSKGNKQKFSWVTDILISKKNIHEIMRGGRSRWKIENETFNTLKNQNYHFEHNFGHGKKNLSTVFAILMMLAFLIDQVQELCDIPFQKALLKQGRKSYLWEMLRSLFFNYTILTWDDIWDSLAYGYQKEVLKPLDSS